MVIKEDLLKWFIDFLIKKSTSAMKSSGRGIANEPNYQLSNELLKNFKKEKFIHFLETIFAVLIWLICNH